MVSRLSNMNMQFAPNATAPAAVPAKTTKDSLSVVDNRTGKYYFKSKI